MKTPLLCCCFALATLLAHGQTNSVKSPKSVTSVSDETDPAARLKELDETLNNPFSKNLVPPRIAGKIIYQNQVTIGGVAIQQGRTMGANATSDDKGLTVNVGYKPIPLFKTRYLRLVPQVNILATSEDGFVSIFSGGEYQRTLGGGASVLLFVGGGPKTYTERAKKDLQRSYQQMREADVAKWGGSVPAGSTKWQTEYDATAKTFVEAHTLLQAHNSAAWATRYYLDDLTPAERANKGDQKYFRGYLALERKAGYLLAYDWDELDQDEEIKWVADSITIGKSGYDMHRDSVAKRTLARSIRRYDSLLVSTPWVRQEYFWFNAGITGNTMTKPVFEPSASAANIKADRHDKFVIAQVGINYLTVWQHNNLYASASLGLSNRRAYDPANLKTYQVTKQRMANDSVRVVDQQQLYPTEPAKEAIFGYQAQVTWYHHKAVKYGLELSAGKNLTTLTPKFNATFGFFFPVQTGETTLLLMPLVRWIEPGPFVLGVSLTASIPAFVKGK